MMFPLYGFLGIGTLLLLCLFLLGRSSGTETDEVASDPAPGRYNSPRDLTCPPDVLERIFSPKDFEFILTLKSPRITEIFRRERKIIAILWVKRTSDVVRQIMRRHALNVRSSEDLRVAAEAYFLLRYTALLLICGTLIVLIQTAGPLAVRSLAVYASGLVEQISSLGQELQAAVRNPEARGFS